MSDLWAQAMPDMEARIKRILQERRAELTQEEQPPPHHICQVHLWGRCPRLPAISRTSFEGGAHVITSLVRDDLARRGWHPILGPTWLGHIFL